MKSDIGFTTEDNDRSWICDVHGNKIHPLDLRDDEIDIEDIATALSRIPRFLGRTHRHLLAYSVAEHCVRASYQVSFEHALLMEMHDCEEAFFGDTPRPVKYQEIYQPLRLQAELTKKKILVHFGLPPELPAWVHEVDNRMLATEKRDLMVNDGNAQWTVDVEPYAFVITPWCEERARREFLDLFHWLTNRRFAKPGSVANKEGWDG